MTTSINPDKKRYSCSICNKEFGSKSSIDTHINSRIHMKDGITHAYCIDIPTIKCNHCNAIVKSMTRINFMEAHLKICKMKDKPLPTTIINQCVININFVLNPYHSPDMSYLKYAENLLINRVDLYGQIYFNEAQPQNHSILYDETTNKVKIYENADRYTLVDLDKIYLKVSTSLDMIQDKLINFNVLSTDKVKLKEIQDKMDDGYSEKEQNNMHTFGEIAKNFKRIPQETRYKIDDLFT
jgi:hypothetical protein